MVTVTASEGDQKRSRYKLGLSHMEWELTILTMWDMMQRYWVSDFQNLKGMLAITYPAMHCHTPEDRNLKMHHCENLKLTWSSNVTNPHTAVRCSHSAITFSGTPLLLTRNCRII